MDLLLWLLPATVSLSERTLTLPSGHVVPVAVGKDLTPTPTGCYNVIHKVRNPNGRADGIFGGIGIRFDADGNYGLHGTNDQSSIGNAVSGGCIRVRKQDEAQVFEEIKFTTEICIYE